MFVCFASYCLLLVSILMGGPSAAVESTYRLVGTVESKEFTGAVIITPDGNQSFYRLRETLPDGAQLVMVHSDRILVKGPDGSRYEMFVTATGRLQSTAASGAPSIVSPQSPSPEEKDRQSRPSRSRRSSSREE